MTSITAICGMTWANGWLTQRDGTPQDATRVTCQLGRETYGQVGQTWPHTRTTLRRRQHKQMARPSERGPGRIANLKLPDGLLKYRPVAESIVLCR